MNGKCEQCGTFLADKFREADHCPKCGIKISAEKKKDIQKVNTTVGIIYFVSFIFGVAMFFLLCSAGISYQLAGIMSVLVWFALVWLLFWLIVLRERKPQQYFNH